MTVKVFSAQLPHSINTYTLYIYLYINSQNNNPETLLKLS